MDYLIEKSDDSPHKYDIVFENGKCPITDNYVEVVRQRIYLRLRTFYSEWYLTENYGVPWLEKILGHKGAKQTADMIIQEQVRSVRGVAAIYNFSSTFNNTTRQYECSFRVKTDSGETSDVITI